MSLPLPVYCLQALSLLWAGMYSYFVTVHEKQLKDELELAAYAVEQNGNSYLERLVSEAYRITWVAPDGTVLFDTKAQADSLENHADREEIREALTNGEGVSTRYSSTLTEKTQYCAKRLSNGTVLRISAGRATAVTLVLGMLPPIMIVAIIAIVLSAVLANGMAKRIVGPLNRIDLDEPLDNDAYEELSPLLNRIRQQHCQISAQLRDLKGKTEEFNQITRSMREGLVLLDNGGMILSINPAAQELFHADDSCVGQDFLSVDRSHSLSAAIQTAQMNGHSEIRAERNGRVYQFDISLIESGGAALGAVLLSFDITEQTFAERNRREFTANVSHELKTPLQSIIGSAELMENGLVKPEDMPRFIGHIRTEAARLVALIEDIMRLSQLDEETPMTQENVDIYEVANDVISSFQELAAAKNICISLNGISACVNGVRGLLHEMLYNLCDNAIKYNVEGGSVTVDVSRSDREVTVCVKDTGIGIPQEYQSRVFERFFRVDKSHSKATGGTGLGLSIVKHAVQYHHAKIHLQSESGVGTEISIVFPAGQISID